MISKYIIGYPQEQSTYWKPLLVSYSSLAEATAACDLDKQCGGFYDACGNGLEFQPCGSTLQKEASGCGAILYTKGEVLI